MRISSIYCAPEKSAFSRIDEIATATGRALGVDYNYGEWLPVDVMEVGFQPPEIRFQQPVYLRGPEKRLWEHTIREATPTIVQTGSASEDEVNSLLEEMRLAAEDERTLIAQWGMPGVIAVK